jgi:flavin-dependent dehydrogenase
MSGVVVIGGGLAGGAAASALAATGRRVTLFEREAAPGHKICGEFLSGEARRSLAAVGFDVARLGGHPIGRVRLVAGVRSATVALPFEGLGLTRRRLDAALLDHAVALGAAVHMGVAVRGLDCTAGLRLALESGEALAPAALLLATGKHDLRGVRRTGAVPADLIGFKMYFRPGAAAARALDGHIELHLFGAGYAGLQRVEAGMVNLTLLVERAHFKRIGGRWQALLADLRGSNALLDERLTGSVALLEQPLTIFRVPYGFVHRPADDDAPGLFRLGDQMAVIPSFTGDGMAIALHTALAAAGAVLAGRSAHDYHTAMARELGGQIGRAALLYRAARPVPAQRALIELARACPPLVRLAARWTRVSPRAAAAVNGGVGHTAARRSSLNVHSATASPSTAISAPTSGRSR